MNVKFQIQSIIPPHPPLAKGGWGDLSFGFDLKFAMNHVRFMISPELYVVQETLTFAIFIK